MADGKDKKGKVHTLEINGIIVFLLSMLANVLGALFQLLASHIINDETLFAELNAVLSLFNILALPSTVAGCVITKYISELYSCNKRGEVKGVLQAAAKVLGMVSTLFAIIMLMFYRPLKSWLHIQEQNIVIVAVLLAAATIPTAIFIGGLQGTKQFFLYGIFGLVGPICKIIAVSFSIFWENKVVGILIVWLVGIMVSYIVGTLLLNRTLGKIETRSSGLHREEIVKYTIKLMVANGGIILLTNLDMLLVKHMYNNQAGMYAAARVLAFCVIYVTNTLVIILFPMVADSSHTEKENLKLLKKCLFYNIVIGAVATAGIYCLADLGIQILLGKTYLGCKAYLLPNMALVFPISLLTLLANFAMARNRTRTLSITLILGAVGSVAGGLCMSNSIFLLIGYLSAVLWIMVIINIVGIFRRGRNENIKNKEIENFS